MTREQAEKLLKAGEVMRQAQKAYFKSRMPKDLRWSIDTEEKFDVMLQECARGVTQCNLLNH
jgi:hypothetical protein